MRVNELIAALLELPGDALVYVNGHSHGLEDVGGLEAARVKRYARAHADNYRYFGAWSAFGRHQNMSRPLAFDKPQEPPFDEGYEIVVGKWKGG